jgi:hypothetical protein
VEKYSCGASQPGLEKVNYYFFDEVMSRERWRESARCGRIPQKVEGSFPPPILTQMPSATSGSSPSLKHTPPLHLFPCLRTPYPQAGAAQRPRPFSRHRWRRRRSRPRVRGVAARRAVGEGGEQPLDDGVAGGRLEQLLPAFTRRPQTKEGVTMIMCTSRRVSQ